MIDKYEDMVKNIAKKSTIHKKYVAILIYQKKVISIGYNYFKGKEYFIKDDYDYKLNKHTVHAEVACINNLKNKNILSKSSMIIFKIKNNEVEKTFCCENCYKVIKKYNIRRII